MDRRGHIETGTSFAVAAVVCALAAHNGGDAFPRWLWIALWAAAAGFGLLACIGLATPRWPNLVLDAPERSTANSRKAPDDDAPGPPPTEGREP